MKLAAIDIGSNSVHLVIVNASPGQHLEIIDREKEMIRLGSGTLRFHRFSDETIDRAVEVLHRYKHLAEANGVEVIIATATAAVREALNADEFVERVRKEVGLTVEVLPGIEEARLIALAVSEVTEFNGRRALIIDIGGGSTEFIITSGLEPKLLLSLRLGAVRLTEKFITTDPISSSELDKLVSSIRADLTRVVWETTGIGFDFVIGTSGTALNLVKLINQAGSDATHGFSSFANSATLDQLKRINRKLAKMSLRERKNVPGLEKKRADIITAGGLLLETILGELGADSITTCDWSLREGVILNYLRNVGFPDRRDEAAPASVQRRSVLSLAKRYNYDAGHSHLVAHLAKQIFDGTRELHGFGSQERKLLEFAALLHDIGYHIAHNNHHRHALYLIKNSEMPGFAGNEIAVMANVARYHRGSLPEKTADSRVRREHEDFRALDRAHRRVVMRLAAILRVADALDRRHNQVVRDVACKVEGEDVKFLVTPRGNCELELWSAQRKADWFRNIFRVTVSFAGTREEVPVASKLGD